MLCAAIDDHRLWERTHAQVLAAPSSGRRRDGGRAVRRGHDSRDGGRRGPERRRAARCPAPTPRRSSTAPCTTSPRSATGSSSAAASPRCSRPPANGGAVVNRAVRLRLRPGDRGDRHGLRPGRSTATSVAIQARSEQHRLPRRHLQHGQRPDRHRRPPPVQLSMTTGDRVAGFDHAEHQRRGQRPRAGRQPALRRRRVQHRRGQPHGGLVAAERHHRRARPPTWASTSRSTTTGPTRRRAADHAQAPVGVDKFDITPDGTRMIAIGNFRQADGLARDQVGADRTSARPRRRSPRTGGPRRYEAGLLLLGLRLLRPRRAVLPGRLLLRHRHHRRRQPRHALRHAQPASRPPPPATTCSRPGRRTPAATRCSRSRSPAAADLHRRPPALDEQRQRPRLRRPPAPCPGPGISALDPRTGVPLAWNPGRNPRGVGAEALLATTTGLYVGMDTPLHRQPPVPAARPGVLPARRRRDRAVGDHRRAAGERVPGRRRCSAVPAATTGEVLFRVNAGGPEVPANDGGPAWTADEGTDNPLRTPGGIATPRGPLTTSTARCRRAPRRRFSRRAQPRSGRRCAGPSQSWSFPVAAGTTVDVRLYLADRDPATTTRQSRLFIVSLEGATRLNFFDINGDVGHDVGTMKSFRATSDGTINLDFGTLISIPIVSAIEIVEADPGTPPQIGVDDVSPAGSTAPPPRRTSPPPAAGSVEPGARGLHGRQPAVLRLPGRQRRLLPALPHLRRHRLRRPPVLDPYNDPDWSDLLTGTSWFDVIPNFYRGMVPTFYGQLPSVSSMVFQSGRLYYTRTGFAGLYSRPLLARQRHRRAGAAGAGGRRLRRRLRRLPVRRPVLLGHGARPASCAARRGTTERRTRPCSRSRAGPAMAAPGRRGPCSSVPAVRRPASTSRRRPTSRVLRRRLTCNSPAAAPRTPTAPSSAALELRRRRAPARRPTRRTPTPLPATTGHPDRHRRRRREHLGDADGVGHQRSAGPRHRAARHDRQSAARVTSATVTVPAAVQAGDGMVLVLSTNSTATGARRRAGRRPTRLRAPARTPRCSSAWPRPATPVTRCA